MGCVKIYSGLGNGSRPRFPWAGSELTLALIEVDVGQQVALNTAQQLVLFIKRLDGQTQFGVPLAAHAHDNGRVFAAHLWIPANLSAAHGQAGQTGQTGQHGTAHVRACVCREAWPHTCKDCRCHAQGCGVSNTVETGLPLKSSEMATGYGVGQTLRGAFQRQLGVSPTAYRDRFSAHEAGSTDALA